MAGSDQSKKSGRQNDRLGPSIEQGSSRVSNVVGSVGSQSARGNQQMNKQGTRRQEQSASKRAQGNKQRKKKSPSPGGNRPANVSSPDGTADSRAISKVRDAWSNMQPHHQQRILGILLLFLALFLFAALTVFRSAPVFSAFNGAFIALFGWSAFLLSIGLIAFAVAYVIEGIRNRKFIRWTTIVGLVVLWLLLLVESQLLLGGTTAGFLGALLVRPLLGWPPVAGHVLLIGLFGIVTIVTFQITLGHFMYITRAFRGIGATGQRGSSPNNASGPSPFLGQRPRFSRYGSGSAGSTSSSSANGQPGSAPPADVEQDDQQIIVFEADFGDEDDPLNDINIHKQHISRVPRGPRPALPLDPAEHNDAIQGVNQQPLPFNQAAGKNAEKKIPTMESLAPNPLQKNQPKFYGQAEDTMKASSWKLPDTTMLNNPEEVKLLMLGDDTSTLAKTIQDTLRSFRVEAEVKQEDISIGPTVIRFGIRPTGKPEMKPDAQGKLIPVKDAGGNIVYEARTRVSRIMALQNDLALVLEAKTIRMEAPVPGRPYVGVEIPNKNSRLVTLREVLESKEYQAAKAKSKLAIALGKDVAGAVRVSDLARMPHLLIAGATGSGKCLAYNEPVFLADGRVVKAQELIGQSAQVIGVTDTQTMQQISVSATFTENGVQDVFEIKLDNGIILRRTGEHPLWAACLNEDQHVGRQPNGKAMRRTRTINPGWVQAKDLRVCGNRPHFDGHVILCPLTIQQQGTALSSGMVDVWKERVGSTVKAEKLACAVRELATNRENAATEWNAWRRARPLSDQKFADCPQGYEWRKIVSFRRITAPTVNIEVHSENHAFVGYAVEHNSVCINTIIASILTQASPEDVRLLLVDPKMVELNMYVGIPHLLFPVVTEVERVVPLLKNAISEMEKRYRLFSQLGVRNLDGYRKLRAEKIARGDNTLKSLPAIVVIIDELADLMMAAPEEVEGMICRLAQLARATGIHLVVATQRPSVDVITGLIKANIPTRISFMVSSAVDSRTIIDMGGAERLLGRGDMLYLPADAGRPERIQGSFLADEEAEKLVAYWRLQSLEQMNAMNSGTKLDATAIPQPIEPGWEIKEHISDDFELEDDLLERAEEVVREYERASISLLQRRLRIGYSRAARLIDLLEQRGIIGQFESGGRSREVLDTGNGSERRGGNGGGEGRTIADEVADIIADEKAREEFLKKQREAGRPPTEGTEETR